MGKESPRRNCVGKVPSSLVFLVLCLCLLHFCYDKITVLRGGIVLTVGSGCATTSHLSLTMKVALNIRELQKSQLVRVIAILFLLHSGADMLFPQLCNEESFGGSLSSTLLSSSES